MQPYALWIACGIAVAASATDIWRFKVHNRLTFPAVAAGIAYHALAPWGGGWSYGLAGFAVGLGLLLVLTPLACSARVTQSLSPPWGPGLASNPCGARSWSGPSPAVSTPWRS